MPRSLSSGRRAQGWRYTLLRPWPPTSRPIFEPASPGFGGITLAHNVRRKEEVAEVINLAQTAGGKIIKQAQDVFWGGHSGYFTDPDGYFWEVAWSPRGAFDETGAVVL